MAGVEFVVIMIALLAVPFVLRRIQALRIGAERPTSGKQRALVAAVIGVNTIPYAPIWPGSSGGDGLLENWLTVFLLVSLPFWLLALAVWRMCRNLAPPARCAVAELSALVLQVVVWSAGYVEAVVAFVVIRAADGLLLLWLTRDAHVEAPAVHAGAV